MNTITNTARGYLYLDESNIKENEQDSPLWKVAARPSCYLSLGLLPLMATLTVGSSNLMSYLITKFDPMEDQLNTWATIEKAIAPAPRRKLFPHRVSLAQRVDDAVSSILYVYKIDTLRPDMKQDIHLNLSENHFHTIPKEIGQLTNLTDLHLSDNDLTTLPAEIGQLTNLAYISLYENQLTSLPNEIGQLTKLIELCLPYNQLTSLPNEIGQLKNLERLYLHNNQLTTLPQEIGQLTKLWDFRIHDNPNLRDLPLSLGNIPGLTKISIENTSISSESQQQILTACRALRDK